MAIWISNWDMYIFNNDNCSGLSKITANVLGLGEVAEPEAK